MCRFENKRSSFLYSWDLETWINYFMHGSVEEFKREMDGFLGFQKLVI